MRYNWYHTTLYRWVCTSLPSRISISQLFGMEGFILLRGNPSFISSSSSFILYLNLYLYIYVCVCGDMRDCSDKHTNGHLFVYTQRLLYRKCTVHVTSFDSGLLYQLVIDEDVRGGRKNGSVQSHNPDLCFFCPLFFPHFLSLFRLFFLLFDTEQSREPLTYFFLVVWRWKSIATQSTATNN